MILKILSAWLLADFLSGIVHWLEDKVLLGESRFEFLNGVKRDNDLHHAKPSAMTRFSLWQNMNTTAVITFPLSAGLWLVGAPMIAWLSILFASFANVVHRFAHMPRGKVPLIVRWLQSIGLFISFDHHHSHHFDDRGLIPKDKSTARYCPMTCWLNPILDHVGFFRQLERLWRRA